MELTLFVISVLIIGYHLGKLLLNILAWVASKTVLRGANKRNEEIRMQNVQFLMDMGIEVCSDSDYPKNYTSIR